MSVGVHVTAADWSWFVPPRQYGCTRIEIGVQSIYEDVARDTNRYDMTHSGDWGVVSGAASLLGREILALVWGCVLQGAHRCGGVPLLSARQGLWLQGLPRPCFLSAQGW